ncbi:MAG: hypothetical protein K6G58_05650 [Lachnospiraceae bacterium]|nr:hypothetical protein [Lachnospiraceae bacterium]
MQNSYNSYNEIQKRRLLDIIGGCGVGYILFGFWSVVKVFMIYSMGSEALGSLTAELGGVSSDAVVINFIIGICFALISLAVNIVHLYIGVGALRYSRERTTKKRFITVASVVLLFHFVGLPGAFTDGKGNYSFSYTGLASLMIELTMMGILINMICGYERLKKLRAGRTAGGHDAG